MLSESRFILLNQEGEITGLESWNEPAKDRLWLYNLHYFDDLNAMDAKTRTVWHRKLITRWIAENPPTSGNGWEPYPLSLRIVNWIKWTLWGNEMEEVWQSSLAMQARFLRKRLEVHLLGNHLFANAKALVFAGLYFSGEEADEWLEKGLSILAREVPEQVLSDGGHFELSPMYHCIILEDLLDLVNISSVYRKEFAAGVGLPQAQNKNRGQRQDWVDVIQRMHWWLKSMCHQDGEVAFFNDTTMGIAAVPQNLKEYAERLGLSEAAAPEGAVTRLSDSGYMRLEQGEAIVLLDVARIGPDYLPGHAHADTLSFELSLFGQRVVVNSGISCYGVSDKRLQQRSTAAHSTVEINGENSSEVWGRFRVARRARPLGLDVLEDTDEVSVTCSHDGYRRLPGKPIHRRTWQLKSGELKVTDRVNGIFRQAVARFYIHPDVTVEFEVGSNHGIFQLKTGQIVKWQAEGGQVTVKEAVWHPEFGLDVTNRVIEVEFAGEETVARFEF